MIESIGFMPITLPKLNLSLLIFIILAVVTHINYHISSNISRSYYQRIIFYCFLFIIFIMIAIKRELKYSSFHKTICSLYLNFFYAPLLRDSDSFANRCAAALTCNKKLCIHVCAWIHSLLNQNSSFRCSP